MSIENLTESDLIDRAREERAAIFQKYERGREPGVQIDPWEDPTYEIYHVTDRFGFLHDKRLPSRLDAIEAKQRQMEMEREKKWLKMNKDWDKYSRKDKLTRRVYKGIPDKFRGEMWRKFLDLDRAKKEQEGKYKNMKELAKEHSTDARQIDLDVNRTYRDHIMFRERYGIKQQALFYVLVAYAIYNSEIGYCQGMSQIAGLLLMYLDEEDSFWALSKLMSDEKHAMHGFFIPGFPKLMRFQDHHDKILTKFLPKLKKHLDKHEVHSSLYTLKWFFQCFLDRVPFTLTLRLWDIYILEGEKVLTSMPYNLLKMHRKQLSKLNMEGIVHYIQVQLERDFGYDDDTVITSLSHCMEELIKAKMLLPGKSPQNELAQRPFGLLPEPKLDQLIGRRSGATVLNGSSTMRPATPVMSTPGTAAGSHLARHSYGEGSSKYSYDPSIDDCNSYVGAQSSESRRNSATETSQTSTADLSLASAITLSRSQHLEDEEAALANGERSVTPLSIASATSQLASATSPARNGARTVSPDVTTTLQRQMSFYDNVPSTMITGGSGEAPPSEPPTPKFAGSPDTVRIFVPYRTSDGSVQQNGDLTPTPEDGNVGDGWGDQYNRHHHRIVIKVGDGINSGGGGPTPAAARNGSRSPLPRTVNATSPSRNNLPPLSVSPTRNQPSPPRKLSSPSWNASSTPSPVHSPSKTSPTNNLDPASPSKNMPERRLALKPFQLDSPEGLSPVDLK